MGAILLAALHHPFAGRDSAKKLVVGSLLNLIPGLNLLTLGYALRLMRERGEELFAIYHSHPSSPATPSIIDLEEAGYPEALYLIISLNTKGVLEVRGFRLNGHDAKEVPLELG